MDRQLSVSFCLLVQWVQSQRKPLFASSTYPFMYLGAKNASLCFRQTAACLLYLDTSGLNFVTLNCMLAGHLRGGDVVGVGGQGPWQRP